jgi:putative membrane protein
MSIDKKQHIAITIAFIFHLCGAIGILFTPYSNWFISNTWLNLVIMFALIVYTQYVIETTNNTTSFKTNGFLQFIVFAIAASCIGFFAEVIGVNKGVLFGDYSYGNNMGFKLANVPLLIGLQWFVTIYCCGVIMSFVSKWSSRKLKEMGKTTTTKSKPYTISFLIDASLLATFFDYIIEPAAQKLGYWQWANNVVPFYNYTCWFVTSLVIMLVFNQLRFNKINKFAIHLFIIQALFFLAISKLV